MLGSRDVVREPQLITFCHFFLFIFFWFCGITAVLWKIFFLHAIWLWVKFFAWEHCLGHQQSCIFPSASLFIFKGKIWSNYLTCGLDSGFTMSWRKLSCLQVERRRRGWGDCIGKHCPHLPRRGTDSYSLLTCWESGRCGVNEPREFFLSLFSAAWRNGECRLWRALTQCKEPISWTTYNWNYIICYI